MHTTWKSGIAVFLVMALVAALAPTPCLAGDIGGGSDGAAITVGILVAVIGVLVVIGMVSDIDYFTHRESIEKRAAVDQSDVMPVVEHSELYRDLPPARIREPAGSTLECTALGLTVRF